MMRAEGQEIQEEGPLQTGRDGGVFRSFRYVVDRPHPSYSSCDRLSAAGVGRFDAASSERRSWGRVRRRRDGEYLWRTDDPCVGKVHRLVGCCILCDHPLARHCVFTQRDRANPGSTRVAERRGSVGLCDASHVGVKPRADCKPHVAGGKPRGKGALALIAGGNGENREVSGIRA